MVPLFSVVVVSVIVAWLAGLGLELAEKKHEEGALLVAVSASQWQQMRVITRDDDLEKYPAF